jgi:hypothetical protein
VNRFTVGDNTPVPHERVKTDAKRDSVGYSLDEQQEHYLTFRDAMINFSEGADESIPQGTAR